jgi:serine/threonine-protein kinase 24/25/MST4
MPSETPRSMSLHIGKVLGYGSYGVVYRGRLFDPVSERGVAVKALGGGASREVRRELELMRAAAHESVTDLIAAFTYNGCAYLVLELCELGSVADLIAQRGAPLAEAEIAAVCKGALRGLEHLHYACALVHRDMKGGNLLLNTALDVKIADFGIAHQLEKGAQNHRGTVIGSPLYMAPELIEEGEASFAIDVWALGITAIEMAEMVPPLNGMVPPISAMYKIVRDPPPLLADATCWTDDFRAFVSSCLRKLPADRPEVSYPPVSMVVCLMYMSPTMAACR